MGSPAIWFLSVNFPLNCLPVSYGFTSSSRAKLHLSPSLSLTSIPMICIPVMRIPTICIPAIWSEPLPHTQTGAGVLTRAIACRVPYLLLSSSGNAHLAFGLKDCFHCWRVSGTEPRFPGSLQSFAVPSLVLSRGCQSPRFGWQVESVMLCATFALA